MLLLIPFRFLFLIYYLLFPILLRYSPSWQLNVSTGRGVGADRHSFPVVWVGLICI